MNRRRKPVRRSHSPEGGEALPRRPPRMDLHTAGVGIASQKPFFDRISGPVSCAPLITGAFDQSSAATFRLSPDFGKLAGPAPVLFWFFESDTRHQGSGPASGG
jgi:hypothetical protein